MNAPATVVVADDHPLVRAGVSASLQDKDFCRVVGEANDRPQALELVDQFRPNLLVLDLEMAGDSGPDQLIRTCREVHPPLKVLILSSHIESRHLLPLKDLDLDGFVLKSEAPDSLVQAIRVALQGEKWFSHQVADILTGSTRASDDPVDRLSQREFQVLRLMNEGKDNQAIADVLGLSKQTVRRYATIIYEKLGVKSRVEAILLLDARGLSTAVS